MEMRRIWNEHISKTGNNRFVKIAKDDSQSAQGVSCHYWRHLENFWGGCFSLLQKNLSKIYKKSIQLTFSSWL